MKLVSLLLSVLISLLLRRPAKLASVELVGFPTEANDPLFPPKDPVFVLPKEPRPADPPIWHPESIDCEPDVLWPVDCP